MKYIHFYEATLTRALAGINHMLNDSLSAPGDPVMDCWTLVAQTVGGVCDGEILLLRLPSQPHDVAVVELGPDGPGYR